MVVSGVERHAGNGRACHIRQFGGGHDELASSEVVKIEDIGGNIYAVDGPVIHGQPFEALQIGERTPTRGRLIVFQRTAGYIHRYCCRHIIESIGTQGGRCLIIDSNGSQIATVAENTTA